MNCAHCRKLVDAFIDEELDAGTREAMQAHIERCAECKAAIEERGRLRAVLAGARDHEPVPQDVAARLRERLDAAELPVAAARGPTWLQAAGLAAAAATIAVGLTFALTTGPSRATAVLERIVERHIAALGSVPGDGLPSLQFASQERHRLKPWFQGRVPLSPPVADLSAQGVELLGGRVERIGSVDAAVVVYRIRRHPVDLFCWRDGSGPAPPRTDALHGFNIVQWSIDGIACAAVSDLNAAELRHFAQAVAAGNQ
jgi:anti-sigma factor RsiW